MNYENKLALAKEALESGSYDKDTIEYIFPELKENTDERIRKAIINIFATHKDYEVYFGVSVEDIRVWLERQGESNKASIWKHWKDGIAGNGEGEPIYLTKVGNTYSLTSVLGFECDYIELSELDSLMLEKQKPIEWSEDDNFMFYSIIKDFDRLRITDESTPASHYTECMNWLGSLKQRIEHKSINDTDEEIVEAVKETSVLDMVDDKPVEWSNSNFQILRNCIYAIRLAKEGKTIYADYNEMIDWLKSLKDRYTWKPNEEQIKALAEALSLAKNCGEESAFDLRTLYEQLKKL